MNSRETLTYLSDFLGKRDLLPKKIDLAEVGPLTIVNSYDEVNSSIISSSIMTGIDSDIYTATLKSLSEYYERKAFSEGYFSNDPICQTERSDGFAAFPKTDIDFKTKARDNALNEAVERFVWSSWWDDLSAKYEVSEEDPFDESFFGEAIHLLKETNELLEIKKIKVVTPEFSGFPDKELLIIFCEIENGVISGGACGNKKERKETLLRAICELARHALALWQGRSKGLAFSSFYEKRLNFFATQEGLEIYGKRLSVNGSRAIEIPELLFDSEVKHQLRDIFYVHRCLFKNQPPFVGGALERLCL